MNIEDQIDLKIFEIVQQIDEYELKKYFIIKNQKDEKIYLDIINKKKCSTKHDVKAFSDGIILC